MKYFYVTLRRLGYPVVLVTLTKDPGQGKTIEVKYFSECDKIAGDLESIYKDYNVKK
jgi:hypothetical protein